VCVVPILGCECVLSILCECVLSILGMILNPSF